MHEVLDFIFKPISWLEASMAWSPGDEELSQMERALTIGISALLLLFVLVVLAGFALYALLAKVELSAEDLLKQTWRTTDLEELERAAYVHVWVSWVLTGFRAKTGVRLESSPPPPPDLPPTRPGRTVRTCRWVLRFVVGFVTGVGRLVPSLFRWPTSALLIYVIAGVVWVVYRPDIAALVDASVTAVGPFVTATGIALFTLVVTILAVQADHGVTPRRRGRNQYMRDRAAQHETLLANLRATALSTAKALWSLAEEVGNDRKFLAHGSVTIPTCDRFFVYDGIVQESSGHARWKTVPSFGGLWPPRIIDKTLSIDKAIERFEQELSHRHKRAANRLSAPQALETANELLLSLHTATTTALEPQALVRQAPRRARRMLARARFLWGPLSDNPSASLALARITAENLVDEFRRAAALTLEAQACADAHLACSTEGPDPFQEPTDADQGSHQTSAHTSAEQASRRIQRLIDAEHARLLTEEITPLFEETFDLQWEILCLAAECEFFADAVAQAQHPDSLWERIAQRFGH